MESSSDTSEYEAQVLEAVKRSLGSLPASQGVAVRSVELTGSGRKRAVEVHWRDTFNEREKSLVWQIYDDPEFVERPDGLGEPSEVASWVFLAVIEPP
ncbi:MAG TPA: hypothetical protein VNB64_07185 [Solirubrobacteraceae bacterium]|nr:hypothetical protein [Solirubrobacteraceae bacterium]